jgi:hypothetical protein
MTRALTFAERAQIYRAVEAAAKVRENERSRLWRKNNPDKVREINRAWRKRNKHEVAATERFNRKFGPSAEARRLKKIAYQREYMQKLVASGAFRKGGKYARSKQYDPAKRRARYLLEKQA